jgi:uncharacterized protein (DUF3084 family)
MSVFGLRPRHTSILITVVTGMVIFLVTILLAVLISEPVKTALFGMKALKEKEQELTKRIADLNKRLQHTPFVISVNEIMAVGKVRCGGTAQDARRQLEALLSEANNYAIVKNIVSARSGGGNLQIPPDTKLVGYFPEEYKDLQEKIAKERGVTGVILFANWNAGPMQQVGVNFRRFEIKRAFRKDEVILQQKFNGREAPDKILMELLNFLQIKLQAEAERRGMLRNPQTNTMFETTLEQLLAKRQEIRSYGRSVTVSVIANRDIDNIDPLDVRIQVGP